MSDGDQGLRSSDDRDSGLRTSSEPTSPLTSEVENDSHLVSNFIAQLPSPTPDMTGSSQHRHVTIIIWLLFCTQYVPVFLDCNSLSECKSKATDFLIFVIPVVQTGDMGEPVLVLSIKTLLPTSQTSENASQTRRQLYSRLPRKILRFSELEFAQVISGVH